MHVQGGGKFDGTPATIDANLYFHPKTGPRAKYRIGLTLDDEARQRLGWDFAADRISGPVALDATYSVPIGGSKAEVDLALDLKAARLTVDEFGWQKPPLLPATAKLTHRAGKRRSRPAAVDRGQGARPRRHVRGDPERRPQAGRAGRHPPPRGRRQRPARARVSRRAGGGWRADIRAARLDLSREIKHALSDDTPASPAPLQIDARVARLILGAKREARDVSAEMLRDHGTWQTIKLDGRYPNGHKLALSLGGDGGGRRIHFDSDDLGASFSLFGIADNVVGGSVTVDGTLAEADGHRVLRAHIDGRDYALVRAPVLARLLSFASFEGLASMMSGSGIPFTTLRGDLTYSRGRIALDRLLAFGGALGITANGWIDTGQDRIDVEGTLAPAYVLNSILGNVPVLGHDLDGRRRPEPVRGQLPAHRVERRSRCRRQPAERGDPGYPAPPVRPVHGRADNGAAAGGALKSAGRMGRAKRDPSRPRQLTVGSRCSNPPYDARTSTCRLRPALSLIAPAGSRSASETA